MMKPGSIVSFEGQLWLITATKVDGWVLWNVHGTQSCGIYEAVYVGEDTLTPTAQLKNSLQSASMAPPKMAPKINALEIGDAITDEVKRLRGKGQVTDTAPRFEPLPTRKSKW